MKVVVLSVMQTKQRIDLFLPFLASVGLGHGKDLHLAVPQSHLKGYLNTASLGTDVHPWKLSSGF